MKNGNKIDITPISGDILKGIPWYAWLGGFGLIFVIMYYSAEKTAGVIDAGTGFAEWIITTVHNGAKGLTSYTGSKYSGLFKWVSQSESSDIIDIWIEQGFTAQDHYNSWISEGYLSPLNEYDLIKNLRDTCYGYQDWTEDQKTSNYVAYSWAVGQVEALVSMVGL